MWGPGTAKSVASYVDRSSLTALEQAAGEIVKQRQVQVAAVQPQPQPQPQPQQTEPDPCETDPLSDVSCPNYETALKEKLMEEILAEEKRKALEKQCESDPLIDPSCPNYETALKEKMKADLLAERERKAKEEEERRIAAEKAEAEREAQKQEAARKRQEALAGAVYKNCDEFVASWLANYNYAKGYYRKSCEDSSDGLVIYGRPGTQSYDEWKYSFGSNVIVRTNTNGKYEYFNPSNFAKTDKNGQISGGNNGNLSVVENCSNIKYAYNDVWAYDHQFNLAIGYDAQQIVKNSGVNWSVSKNGNKCYADVVVQGLYNGNSIYKSVRCEIREIEKSTSDTSSFVIKSLGIGAGFDDGCRRN